MIILLLLFLAFCRFLVYQAEFTLPTLSPSLNSTNTLLTQPPPSSISFYDVLSKVISKAKAVKIRQTADEPKLSPAHSALEVT